MEDWRYSQRTANVMKVLLVIAIVMLLFSKISDRIIASKQNSANVKK